DRLDDRHPQVRDKARQALVELAAKDLRDPVLAEGMRLLAKGSWRGLEESALLLAQLGDKPGGGRLGGVLGVDRQGGLRSAAWGLRKLAVPETLPGVQQYVEAELGRQLGGRSLPGRRDVGPTLIDHQLSQLNQLLGRQKYAPADGTLRKFVPRMKA